MIATLGLQTLHISVKARLDVAKLNLMLSSDFLWPHVRVQPAHTRAFPAILR
jgi:hypothetical protein